MADKRQVRRGIKQLQRIRTWQLVVLLVLGVFISATLLRMNNVGMIQRREAVHAADKANQPDEVRDRLYDLHRYAAAHMNANTGPVYLQHQYDRDVEAAIAKAAESEEGQTINAQAEAVCRPQFSGWSDAYMACFLAELEKHPTSEALPEVEYPEPNLYKYEFASPIWSPDFAGWSVVICLVIVAVILLRATGIMILKILLRRHYRGV